MQTTPSELFKQDEAIVSDVFLPEPGQYGDDVPTPRFVVPGSSAALPLYALEHAEMDGEITDAELARFDINLVYEFGGQWFAAEVDYEFRDAKDELPTVPVRVFSWPLTRRPDF